MYCVSSSLDRTRIVLCLKRTSGTIIWASTSWILAAVKWFHTPCGDHLRSWEPSLPTHLLSQKSWEIVCIRKNNVNVKSSLLIHFIEVLCGWVYYCPRDRHLKRGWGRGEIERARRARAARDRGWKLSPRARSAFSVLISECTVACVTGTKRGWVMGNRTRESSEGEGKGSSPLARHARSIRLPSSPFRRLSRRLSWLLNLQNEREDARSSELTTQWQICSSQNKET